MFEIATEGAWLKDTASRREFIKAVGVGALTTGIGANVIIPRPAHAAQRTLKILQWVHFVPAYDEWFNETYVKEWGCHPAGLECLPGLGRGSTAVGRHPGR